MFDGLFDGFSEGFSEGFLEGFLEGFSDGDSKTRVNVGRRVVDKNEVCIVGAMVGVIVGFIDGDDVSDVDGDALDVHKSFLYCCYGVHK